ncbi:MAG: SDR family oxidoreductase [Dehalococcoidales bacterium]|nr:SDR family oxidoreductase [Dehalococcoidales bacterium]
MDLKGKVALITGGGTGIGAAIARRFTKDGAKVCITGRRQQTMEKVTASLPEGSAVTFAGDVSDIEDARQMVAAAVNFGGKLDVLVNNAGIDPPGSILEVDPNLWKKVIDINLNGPFYMIKAALPYFLKNGGGSIINIASLAGIRCIPAMPAYCSSKAGLIMLTQQAALDYGVYKIRCNVICPGAIRTDMLEHSMTPLAETLNTDVSGALAKLTSLSPLRRPGTPDEMTGICSYLASDESTFMTGAVLVVDGGASIVDVNGAAVSSVGMGWGGAR